MLLFPFFGKRKPIHEQTLADYSITSTVNEDIIREILVRLPLRSLLRFKSVSKQWLALISSIPNYFHRINPNNLVFISGLFLTKNTWPFDFHFVPLARDYSRVVSSLDFLTDPSIQFLHSCNGLLCYSRKSTTARQRPPHDGYGYGYDPTAYSYYICNLTNKKSKLLSIPTNAGYLIATCIAFDPSKSPHYKVVIVYNYTCFYKILVYSSETRSWSRFSQSPFQAPSGTGFKHGVYCNGAIHWCSNTETSIYFDVDNECIKTMPMPLHTISKFQYFGESRGSLYLVHKCEYPDTLLKILELEKDYSRWVVKYCLNLNPTTRHIWKPHMDITEHNYGLQVLSLIHGVKEEEELQVLLSTTRGVISYDHKHGTIKRIFYMLSALDFVISDDVESSGQKGPSVHQYIETLSCV